MILYTRWTISQKFYLIVSKELWVLFFSVRIRFEKHLKLLLKEQLVIPRRILIINHCGFLTFSFHTIESENEQRGLPVYSSHQCQSIMSLQCQKWSYILCWLKNIPMSDLLPICAVGTENQVIGQRRPGLISIWTPKIKDKLSIENAEI